MMQDSDQLQQQAARLLELSRQPGALDALSDADRHDLSIALELLPKRIEGPLLQSIFPETGPLRRELYAKHMEHFAAGKQFKARAFMAANRVGKSWSGGYETSVHATGWYPDWWQGWKIDKPGEYLVAAKTTKTIKKVPQKTLFGTTYRDKKGKFKLKGNGMIPHDKIMHESAIFMSASPGTLSEISVRFRDSQTEWSNITFLSYEMGRGVFEGAEFDFAWLDEECDEEIYAETAKRLMTTEGRMVLTWTPLDGLTQVVLAFIGEEYKPPKEIEFDMHALVDHPVESGMWAQSTDRST